MLQPSAHNFTNNLQNFAPQQKTFTQVSKTLHVSKKAFTTLYNNSTRLYTTSQNSITSCNIVYHYTNLYDTKLYKALFNYTQTFSNSTTKFKTLQHI